MFGNPWAAPSADTSTMAPPPRWTARRLRQLGRPETLDTPRRSARSRPVAPGGRSERRGGRRLRSRDIGARSRRDYRRSPAPRTRFRARPAAKQHDCRRAGCAPSSFCRPAWPPGSAHPRRRRQLWETRSSARFCGLESRLWQLGLVRCPLQRRCRASGLRPVPTDLDARRGTATSETCSLRRAASHEPSVELGNKGGADPTGRPSDKNAHAQPPYMSITLASADAEAASGSWITVQTIIQFWTIVETVISTLIEIKGYDWPHEEATVEAGPATGQCERGGAAPRPGTSVGGHRHTDRLSSRNALLPLFWPRRPGRVPTGRAPARSRRDNRARRHNQRVTSRPAALSDNRARRVPRGAARSMRRPALLRGSHRTTRNPDGREGRAARHATSKAPRRGRRHRPIHDQRLPRRRQRHPRGCTDRYAHPLGRRSRHTRSRVSAGTDRPTRQERRTRLNKRAPTGQRAGTFSSVNRLAWRGVRRVRCGAGWLGVSLLLIRRTPR